MVFFKNFPNLTVVIACLFWGTYWIPLRFLDSNNDASVWPIFFSFFLLSLILSKDLIKSFKSIIFKKNYYFLSGCFFSALGIALYSESLLRGEIAKVVVLFYLCPIWGTIFAKLFLKQSLTFSRIISIVLGLIGLEIIVGIEKGIIFPHSLVEWIALFAGIAWAMSMTLFHLAKSTSSYEKTSLTTIIIPFLFILFCFIPNGRSLNFPIVFFDFDIIYLWIVLFGIIWLLPSILLTFFSVEILDPGRINILLAFEVVVGFVTAALLTNEVIGLREIFGAIFVVSACFVDVFLNNMNKEN